MAEGWLLDCALSKVSGQPRIIDVELLRFFLFFFFSFFFFPCFTLLFTSSAVSA